MVIGHKSGQLLDIYIGNAKNILLSNHILVVSSLLANLSEYATIQSISQHYFATTAACYLIPSSDCQSISSASASSVCYRQHNAVSYYNNTILEHIFYSSVFHLLSTKICGLHQLQATTSFGRGVCKIMPNNNGSFFIVNSILSNVWYRPVLIVVFLPSRMWPSHSISSPLPVIVGQKL